MLDTNTISETKQPTPNAGVLRSLGRHAGEVALSAITLHEIHYGLQRLPVGATTKRATLNRWLADVVALLPVLDYDEAAAKWHGLERARLEALGLTPPFADSQIAAIAATSGLTLVTRNLTDFKDFSGLMCESWFT